MGQNWTTVICLIFALSGQLVKCDLIKNSLVKPVRDTVINPIHNTVVRPIQNTIDKSIDLQKGTMGKLLNIDTNANFVDIFTNITNFNLTQIKECYDMKVDDEEFNMFEHTVFDAIKMYYKHFGDNFDLAKFPERTKNFFKSMNDIGTYTVECITNSYKYKLGFTQFTDWSDDEFKVLLGNRYSEKDIDSVYSQFTNRDIDQTYVDEEEKRDPRLDSEDNNNNNNNNEGNGNRDSTSPTNNRDSTFPPTSNNPSFDSQPENNEPDSPVVIRNRNSESNVPIRNVNQGSPSFSNNNDRDSTLPPRNNNQDSTLPQRNNNQDSTLPPRNNNQDSTLPQRNNNQDSTLPQRNNNQDSTLPQRNNNQDSTLPQRNNNQDSTLPQRNNNQDSTLPQRNNNQDSTLPQRNNNQDSTLPQRNNNQDSTLPQRNNNQDSTLPQRNNNPSFDSQSRNNEPDSPVDIRNRNSGSDIPERNVNQGSPSFSSSNDRDSLTIQPNNRNSQFNSPSNNDNPTSDSSILRNNTSNLNRPRTKREVKLDKKCLVRNRRRLPRSFDWRSTGKVTPVRYQGKCGSCWAFASLSALESAYLIKGKSRDRNMDLSEQQLLNCARQNGCEGGTSVDAFNYILENRGVPDEKALPYQFEDKTCKKAKKKSARIKDYCLRGIYVKVNGKPEQLTDEEIKYIVREFGPLYATMNADNVAMKNLKTGIYSNENCPKETNHAITIVGWEENAWLVKNSWGRSWGDGGFFRLKMGENMCGINTYVTYPIV